MREDFKPALRAAHRDAKAARRPIISEPSGPLTAPSIAPAPPQAGGNGTGAHDGALPPFISAAHIDPHQIVTPPLLIENLLHRGCKMVLAGGSKSYKSWSLVDLGLSVATGQPWWGMRCQRGVVIYVNFELIQGFLDWRIYHIAKARGMELPPWFLYWNLRHKCYDLTTVARVLKERILSGHPERVDLIIVDPIYKALGGRDENAASDMSALMEEIEDLSDQTGAAVVFGAHFSKGNQAAKEAKDRISGSGVFGRDPDAILTMTRHAQDHCYVVESDLRYVPPLPEFVVRWKFPAMSPDEGLDPSDLWTPTPAKKAADDTEALTDAQVLECLTQSGYQDSAWKAAVKAKHGKAGNAYYASKKRLLESGQALKKGLKYLPSAYNLETD